MWLGLFGLLILLILLAAGIALGGIFTLILVPVAILAALAALITMLMARQNQVAAGGNRKPTSTVGAEQPLPHSPPEQAARAATPAATPDDVLEARRGAGER